MGCRLLLKCNVKNLDNLDGCVWMSTLIWSKTLLCIVCFWMAINIQCAASLYNRAHQGSWSIWMSISTRNQVTSLPIHCIAYHHTMNLLLIAVWFIYVSMLIINVSSQKYILFSFAFYLNCHEQSVHIN